MCGIAGVLEFKGDFLSSPPGELAKKMVAQIYHRGPDDLTYWADERVALGTARLSIVDIKNGRQPVANEDRSLICVFNGEIFNHEDLRKTLEQKGHQLRSRTDTEILTHMYEEYGKDFVKYLNGQFSIALYDRTTHTVYCYRDRVGVRPFYYFYNGACFIFASEIKSIFLEGSVPRSIDPTGIDQIFTFWTMLGEQTIFRDIKQLDAGCMMEVSADSCRITRYWDYPDGTEEKISLGREEDYFELMREKLADSVKLRLKADVPVGVYISGGVDSSVVSQLASQHNKARTYSFSVSFEDPQFDEGLYQRRLADHLGTEHFSVRCSYADISSAFYDALWHIEQPIFRTAPVPLYLLSRLVHKNGFKVVLSGEGSDEILWGYDIFREAKIRKFWARNKDSSRRPLLLKKLYSYLPQFSNPRYFNLVSDFYKQTLSDVNNPLYSHLVRIVNSEANKVYYSDEMRSLVGDESSSSYIAKHLPADGLAGRSLLYKTQYLEGHTLLKGYLLSSQSDRVAMANSVEARFPYLDHTFIEFASRLPDKLKLKSLQDKYILRKSFTSSVPNDLLARPKFAYQAPDIKSFITKGGKWSPLVSEFLSKDALDRSGIFAPERVELLLNKFANTDLERTGTRDNMAFVQMLSFQIVYHQFIEGFSFKNSDKLRLVNRVHL